MEKQLNLGLGKEMFKISLHLVMPESKKVLREKFHNYGNIAKRHRSKQKELPMAKTETV